jgi:hypothetical protein
VARRVDWRRELEEEERLTPEEIKEENRLKELDRRSKAQIMQDIAEIRREEDLVRMEEFLDSCYKEASRGLKTSLFDSFRLYKELCD